jgi:hypothetical protein
VDRVKFAGESNFRVLLQLAGIRAYDPATRTFAVEAQACPEKYLFGWLERDVPSIVPAKPGGVTNPPES